MIKKNSLLKIVSAKHTRGHALWLCFSDGSEHIVDFRGFLEKSNHPEIRKYLQPMNFKSFRLEDGDLMWGDFDLIFPIKDLYENQLERPCVVGSRRGPSK